MVTAEITTKDEVEAKKEPEPKEEVEENVNGQEDTGVKPDSGENYLPFPAVSELNSRFRKVITLCQRTSKIVLMREEQKQKVS